jgi:amino acid adenylation domain-containing protein
MYTSGSTGRPKGVVVPHRGIIRLVRNNDFITITQDDTFLAFAPVSFDASTLEIWTPLLNGACLALYPAEFESAEQFASVLKEHNVSTLWLTAALFNTIADEDIRILSNVRQLLVGGDTLSPTHIRKALDALPQTRVINGYGPTENTTFTCCYNIPRNFALDRSIPIGTPIKNTQVYILDAQLKPVPVGVAGDLYAGGDGLSLGYWNNPELTSAAFIPDHFSGEPNARLYRTGDRARLLGDGN